MAEFIKEVIVRISFSPVAATALEAITEAPRSISVLAGNLMLDRDEVWTGPVGAERIAILYGQDTMRWVELRWMSGADDASEVSP